MNPSKPFLAGAVFSFLGLLLLAEIFLRLTVPTGFWYRHFDVSGDMASLAEVRDRLRYSPRRWTDERPLLLLGDSVLGASALMERRVPQARAKTLSRHLRDRIGEKGVSSLGLGSDGLLLPDIEALAVENVPHPSHRIILFLNVRMFAKDFTEGPQALSRGFLLGNLSEDVRKRLVPATPPSEESRLSDRLYAGMCDHWVLFRETQMLKTLWYYPSQKDFFQRLLERIVGRSEDQAELAEAALKLKTASYYGDHRWDVNGIAFGSLRRVLDQWARQRAVVDIFLVPQNREFLGNSLDQPNFERNRKTLAAFLKSYSGKGIHYVDWADRYPPAYFLDHCHLTAEGNERFAQDIVKHMEPWK